MDSAEVGERERSPETRAALAALAEALTETAQYAAFEEASRRLEADAHAQEALEAYQAGARSLGMLVRQNALSPEQQDELDVLEAAVSAEESISAYSEAQRELSQASLRRKQARNEVTAAGIAELRQLRQQVAANASIADYVKAQQEIVTYLRAVNRELCELVGMDLSSLLPSSCC